MFANKSRFANIINILLAVLCNVFLSWTATPDLSSTLIITILIFFNLDSTGVTSHPLCFLLLPVSVSRQRSGCT